MSYPTLDHEAVLDNIYDTKMAAEYLGISYDTMVKYCTRQKRIRGKIYGKTMIFTRQQLDEFKDS